MADPNYTELTREERIALTNSFRDLAKTYKLGATDIAFQALLEAKNDLIGKVRIVASQNLKATGQQLDDEAYEKAMESEKSSVLKAIGFNTAAKVNELTVKMIVDGSIELWKQFGDVLRGYFDEKKSEKSGGSKEVKVKKAA